MAQMIILVINDEDKMEKILEGFVEIGIRGATIIESVGMGRILAQNSSLFSSIQSMINGSRDTNNTIFAVSKHECKIKRAVEMIREIMNDFKAPDTGCLFVLPVLEAYGFAKPIAEEK